MNFRERGVTSHIADDCASSNIRGWGNHGQRKNGPNKTGKSCMLHRIPRNGFNGCSERDKGLEYLNMLQCLCIRNSSFQISIFL